MRHRVPAPDAVLPGHAERDGTDPLGQRGPRGLAMDAELLRAARDAIRPRSRALDEQARKGGSAQGVEVHHVEDVAADLMPIAADSTVRLAEVSRQRQTLVLLGMFSGRK